MRTITVNPLSQKSIQSAIKQLEAYKKMLQDFPSKYVRALSEYMAQTLDAEAPNLSHHWFLELKESEDKTQGIFIFDGEMQFVEFGSGLIGSNNHEGINTDWLAKLPPPYNKGYESRKGGFAHHTDKEGNDYWVYPKDGKFYSTYGQPANPFIYRSVQQLLDARASIARGILGIGE